MEDIDAMFSDLLGEMDLLTQSLTVEADPLEFQPKQDLEVNFKDLNDTLHKMDDKDLDILMAELAADLGQSEESMVAGQSAHQLHESDPLVAPVTLKNLDTSATVPPASIKTQTPPPVQPPKPLVSNEPEEHSKTDKIKLALEKLKEAKVKKLIVKVVMNDGSSKTLMVDERQTVRDVLDNLFEKTHCDGNVDWSLYEVNPSLQIERVLEDHEYLVELLSAWTRDSENKILFHERPDKYAVFRSPQNFYLWKKEKSFLQDMKEKHIEALVTENFCGPSIKVPDLEGVLYLKEDGKKSWKRRYFLLRASGIYYVPKGKTKTSSDLASFIQFDNVNVYYGTDYKAKHKAPTEFCFILKHPQIQKESHYIKYLCCEDEPSMTLWVTSIRIAKYGATLHQNYKAALRRATAPASYWSSNTTSSNPSTPSTTPKVAKANGVQAPAHPSTAPMASSEPSKQHQAKCIESQGELCLPPPPPSPPTIKEILPPPPRDMHLPPPSPTRPSFVDISHQQTVLPPPHAESTCSFPPPPDDFLDSPPDFIPPPPPGCVQSLKCIKKAQTLTDKKKVGPPPPTRISSMVTSPPSGNM